MSPGNYNGREERQRKLPDPAICRAQPIGFGGLVKCLVDEPAGCPLATDYGTGCFCKNPDVHEMLENSQSKAPRCLP